MGLLSLLSGRPQGAASWSRATAPLVAPRTSLKRVRCPSRQSARAGTARAWAYIPLDIRSSRRAAVGPPAAHQPLADGGQRPRGSGTRSRKRRRSTTCRGLRTTAARAGGSSGAGIGDDVRAGRTRYVTVHVRRTFPSGGARPSPRTGRAVEGVRARSKPATHRPPHTERSTTPSPLSSAATRIRRSTRHRLARHTAEKYPASGPAVGPSRSRQPPHSRSPARSRSHSLDALGYHTSVKLKRSGISVGGGSASSPTAIAWKEVSSRQEGLPTCRDLPKRAIWPGWGCNSRCNPQCNGSAAHPDNGSAPYESNWPRPLVSGCQGVSPCQYHRCGSCGAGP
ncbi:hypothetical protein ABH930_007353 [Kitasatospora sp. GAS204A]|nr:hypothetical protein [Kitasatospora sp. GAS204B]